MEIERKFLVHEIPNLKNYPHKKFIQGYISTDPVIRIRQSDNQYHLCVKSKGHMIREEFELLISEEQFNNLWPKTEHTPIKKTRYYIPIDDSLTAELDVYNDALEGLVTLEVEFSSIDTAFAFIPPSWFGEEVTDDTRYKNNFLSIYGLPK
ncbi:MAG: CYTH domain-containing protein [Cellulosilyticaceae bacterium]